MAVITSPALLARRIGELRRRREALLDRQDRLRRGLPEWALEPLRLVGMFVHPGGAEMLKRGPTPEPVHAPPATGFDDVTYG